MTVKGYMLKQIMCFFHDIPWASNKLTTLKQIRQPSSPSKRENRPPAGVARAADGINMTVFVGVLRNFAVDVFSPWT